ncbi:Arylsulfatase [Planctomycetes bacterium Pan216]|uniref:Arylsulfatase n=1 Tax=Kolteria novifilia TaxID=2527975 RepID=A0A518AWX1_9BACT|nr:Arylsulfatase [Planctomycetes bacterium Pan216]
MSPLLLLCCLGQGDPALSTIDRPNIVLIVADDLGFGDLSCYGHPSIKTPHIDGMAAQGMKFTQFTVAGDDDAASRASLLTGLYPIDTGLVPPLKNDVRGVLPSGAVTIAEILKERDYVSGCFGRWYLGTAPKELATGQGFEEYVGYPPDFRPSKSSSDEQPLVFVEGTKTVERSFPQDDVNQQLTESALRFIVESKAKPFFVYLAFTDPKHPFEVPSHYRGTSLRGHYGDCVTSIDNDVGLLLGRLREIGIAEQTLVIFMSDNGPDLDQKFNGGSAGLLRGGKHSINEGGFRVPCIAWWPGTIKPSTIWERPVSALDLLPTFAGLAGAALPKGTDYPGSSLAPVLSGQIESGTLNDPSSTSPAFFYYQRNKAYAVRQGPWKLCLLPDEEPQLYQVDFDPGEKHSVADEYPAIVKHLRTLIEERRARDDHTLQTK